MIITKEQLQEAIDRTEEIRDGIELDENYSGRYMYGEECWGVVSDEFTLQTFEVHLAILVSRTDARNETDFDAVAEGIMDAYVEIGNLRRRDSMGLSTIYYYPQIELAD